MQSIGVKKHAHTDLCSDEEAKVTAAAILRVRKALDGKDTPDSISIKELLVKAEVSEDTFLQGLKICSKGTSMIMKRAPGDSWINSYNPEVIKAWKPNSMPA